MKPAIVTRSAVWNQAGPLREARTNPVFLFLPPSERLRGWVRQHQLIRFRFPPLADVPVKPYWPRPGGVLAFYPRDPERVSAGGTAPAERKPRAVVIGQPTRMTLRMGGHDFSVYQIEFEPGVLHRLTGIPMDALRDRWIDAEAAFPASFRRLVDQIEDHDDPHAMIAAAERYLLGEYGACRRVQEPSDLVAGAMLSGFSGDVSILGARYGVELRQLRRHFDTRIGISPKLLQRLVRFDRAVRLANSRPGARWLDLAVDSGYHDHQHLGRDFREFTAMAPAAYRVLDAGAPERSFGLFEGGSPVQWRAEACRP
jgi:AraC-like DNA-binding protein